MNTNCRVGLAVMVAVIATGCGVIPSNYRGEYRDPSTGATLELKGAKGTYQDVSGRKIEAKAADLGFAELLAGKAGIYVSTDADGKDILELYWISPDTSSRQEEAELVWFRSELFYTELNLRLKDKARTLEFLHCREGSVLLDLLTKRWQVGCPEDPDYLKMERVKN